MSLLRPTALLAGGALAVHELRYLLAGGGSLEEDAGHGYLPLATVATAALLGLACAHLVRRVLEARRGRGPEAAGPRMARVWLAATAALLAIFTAQELIEGMLATGRALGPAAAFAAGGWLAVPLAGAMGALIALALSAARAAVAAAARSVDRPPRPRPVRLRRPRTVAPPPARPGVLAAHLAGRAPPIAS